jgi:hypothetical protein
MSPASNFCPPISIYIYFPFLPILKSFPLDLAFFTSFHGCCILILSLFKVVFFACHVVFFSGRKLSEDLWQVLNGHYS